MRDGDPGPSPSTQRDVLFGHDVRASLGRASRATAASAASSLRFTSGIVTCSSSPEPREVLLLARLLELRLEPSRIPSRSAACAASAPRRESSFARISLTCGSSDAHLFVEALARLHAHRVGVVRERRALRLERREPADRVVDLRGHAVDLDALSRRGFVEQIDRGVRQRAVLQVTLGETHRGDDRRIADLHLVVRLVLASRCRAGSRWPGRASAARSSRTREAAEEARVALLDLAHAFGRRRREQADFAAREDRLEQIADAAPGRALSEQRVDAR